MPEIDEFQHSGCSTHVNNGMVVQVASFVQLLSVAENCLLESSIVKVFHHVDYLLMNFISKLLSCCRWTTSDFSFFWSHNVWTIVTWLRVSPVHSRVWWDRFCDNLHWNAKNAVHFHQVDSDHVAIAWSMNKLKEVAFHLSHTKLRRGVRSISCKWGIHFDQGGWLPVKE